MSLLPPDLRAIPLRALYDAAHVSVLALSDVGQLAGDPTLGDLDRTPPSRMPIRAKDAWLRLREARDRVLLTEPDWPVLLRSGLWNGMNEAEFVAFFSARGQRELLPLPLTRFLPETDRSLRADVATLIGPRALLITVGRLVRTAYPVHRAVLRRVFAALRDVFCRPPTPAPQRLPSDPALVPAFTEQYTALAGADPLDALVLADGRFTQDPLRPGITWSDAEVMCLGGTPPAVTLFDGPPRCACARGTRCAWVRAALPALAAKADAVRAMHQVVLELVTVPAWRRALRALPVQSTEENLILGVRVSDTRAGWQFAPVRCAPTRDGFKPVAAITIDPEHLAPDRAIAEAFSVLHRQDADVGEVLLPLVDHPRVFWRVRNKDTPLRVRRAELGLRVSRTPAGTLRLDLALDAAPERLSAVRAEALSGSPPRVYTALTPDNAEALVVPLGSARAAIARFASSAMAELPPEAQVDLLQILPGLSATVPVEIAHEALGRTISGDPLPVLRLSREPDGVRVEPAVAPLRGDPATQPVGAGKPLLGGFLDGEPVLVQRDFDAERRAWTDAAARLGLTDPPSEAHLAGDAAAELLLRLIDDAVPVQWSGAQTAVRRSKKLAVKVRSQRDWFRVDGALQLDQGEVPLADVLAALRLGRRYVRLKSGDYAEIAEQLRDGLQQLADGVRGTDSLGSAFSGLAVDALRDAGAQIDAPPDFLALADRLRAAMKTDPELPPLNATLRPYQREGIRWLQRTAAWAPGMLLADDMGLGKTLQALGLLLHRAEGGPALVVAPTSVASNWSREAANFTPQLVVKDARDASPPRAGELRLTTWTRFTLDREALGATRWHTVVFDEAHAIKNPETARAKAARGLDAGVVLALSGTPIENRATELWSLFAATAPGLLGPKEDFEKRFRPSGDKETDAANARALSRLVRPLILRRTKSQVATDLPPRQEVRVDVTPTNAHRAFYAQVQRAAAQVAQGLAEGMTPAQRRVALLASLTRLRQAACHPGLLDGGSGGGRGKLDAMLELVESLREEGEKTLIFSQFTSLLDLVEPALDEAGIPFLRLDGSTPEGERARRVATFQAGSIPVFLLSLKAGGVGLNLTAASSVILLDPWWNPAVEDQAADRAHRIGQRRPVTVYRLVAKGTIEEAVLDLHAEKRALVANVLDGSTASATLDADALMALLLGKDEDLPAEDDGPQPEPQRGQDDPGSPDSGARAPRSRTKNKVEALGTLVDPATTAAPPRERSPEAPAAQTSSSKPNTGRQARETVDAALAEIATRAPSTQAAYSKVLGALLKRVGPEARMTAEDWRRAGEGGHSQVRSMASLLARLSG